MNVLINIFEVCLFFYALNYIECFEPFFGFWKLIAVLFCFFNLLFIV